MSNGDPEVLKRIKRIEAKLEEIKNTLRRMKSTLDYIYSRQG